MSLIIYKLFNTTFKKKLENSTHADAFPCGVGNPQAPWKSRSAKQFQKSFGDSMSGTFRTENRHFRDPLICLFLQSSTVSASSAVSSFILKIRLNAGLFLNV